MKEKTLLDMVIRRFLQKRRETDANRKKRMENAISGMRKGVQAKQKLERLGTQKETLRKHHTDYKAYQKKFDIANAHHTANAQTLRGQLAVLQNEINWINGEKAAIRNTQRTRRNASVLEKRITEWNNRRGAFIENRKKYLNNEKKFNQQTEKLNDARRVLVNQRANILTDKNSLANREQELRIELGSGSRAAHNAILEISRDIKAHRKAVQKEYKQLPPEIQRTYSSTIQIIQKAAPKSNATELMYFQAGIRRMAEKPDRTPRVMALLNGIAQWIQNHRKAA